jgi:hypothetical protein
VKARVIHLAALATLFAGSVVENFGMSDGSDW